jgi:hypothetical protein
MTAFNVVRFRVRPGNEQQFEEAHRMAMPALKGFIAGNLVKTGDQTYCMVGEWNNFQSIVDARPQMISLLDGMRAMLEDLGAGLGVTDPVSGNVVARMGAPKKAAKKPAAPKRKAKRAPARKKAAKKAKKKAKKR